MRAWLGYWWRVMLKVFCFGVFGLGALILGSVIMPLFALVMTGRDPMQLRRGIRALVSQSFSHFTGLMSVLGLIRVEFGEGDRERLREARGYIVVANHPTLIDIVILIACMPQADCIVKKMLFTTPFVRSVVGKVYIPNSLGFDETADRCKASLEEGNSLVIFPEGTRTATEGRLRFKRGAAHIALRTGHELLPVSIQVDDAVGLRKGDPLFSYTRRSPMRFYISINSPIGVSGFTGISPVLAARSLTCGLVEAIK